MPLLEGVFIHRVIDSGALHDERSHLILLDDVTVVLGLKSQEVLVESLSLPWSRLNTSFCRAWTQIAF